EAPGLHRYYYKDFARLLGERHESRRYIEALNQAPGLIDFLVEAHALYRNRAPSGGLPESAAHSEQATTLFQEVLRSSSFDKLPLNIEGISTLSLLKSGREDPDYTNKVRRFEWEAFYRDYGSFFTHFRRHLMEQYGYVLIDSRTGLTDTSGICTRVMPEKLVGVFAPNRQNIDGLKGVIQRAAEYRRDSRDMRGLVAF